MSAIGGSVESVGIAGRTFPVAADADGSRDLGGYSNENQPNGDGSARTIKTRKVWMMSGLTLEIDDDRQDQEYIQDIANGSAAVSLTFTMVSGVVYQGTGLPVGDLKASSQSATMPVDFSGSGVLKQQ